MHREQNLPSESRLPQLGSLEKRLLNNYQHGFPLVARPFMAMAEKSGTTEKIVLQTLSCLQQQGYVSRVGAVFRANAVGASTLAAMAIPDEKLEAVAGIINAFTEVNHNYQREHHFNLWFVVTAKNEKTLLEVLTKIETKTGYVILYLPMLEDYHIDLGFDLGFGLEFDTGFKQDLNSTSVVNINSHYQPAVKSMSVVLDNLDYALVFNIQRGFSIVARPYAEIARLLGVDENVVIQRLRYLLDMKVIKRLGVVVRHRELGYRANAMAVWNIPDSIISELGSCMGQFEFVTLCYQRPRRLPDWPYNLFTMIHGQDRDEVLSNIQRLISRCGLEELEQNVLFSIRRFKQRGAIYLSQQQVRVEERQYG